MKIKTKTPLTEMQCKTILDKMREFYESLAQELGVTVDAADIELSKYASLSARCDSEKGEFDFPLADFRGTSDSIRQGFMEYMNTQSIKLVENALLAILKADRPIVDPAIGPDRPPETEKN